MRVVADSSNRTNLAAEFTLSWIHVGDRSSPHYLHCFHGITGLILVVGDFILDNSLHVLVMQINVIVSNDVELH